MSMPQAPSAIFSGNLSIDDEPNEPKNLQTLNTVESTTTPLARKCGLSKLKAPSRANYQFPAIHATSLSMPPSPSAIFSGRLIIPSLIDREHKSKNHLTLKLGDPTTVRVGQTNEHAVKNVAAPPCSASISGCGYKPLQNDLNAEPPLIFQPLGPIDSTMRSPTNACTIVKITEVKKQVHCIDQLDYHKSADFSLSQFVFVINASKRSYPPNFIVAYLCLIHSHV